MLFDSLPVRTFQLDRKKKVPLFGTESKDGRYCSKTSLLILPRLADPAEAWDSKGMQMTGDKGNKLARVIPEESLSDKLDIEPKLDSTSQKRIGDQLRAMYDELMQQPVPDRFRELLDQLDKREQLDKKGGEPIK